MRLNKQQHVCLDMCVAIISPRSRAPPLQLQAQGQFLRLHCQCIRRLSSRRTLNPTGNPCFPGIETPKLPLSSLQQRKSSNYPVSVRLHKHVSSGRICDAWARRGRGIFIVKVIKRRHAASTACGSLFYETALPTCGSDKVCHGTYASLDGA